MLFSLNKAKFIYKPKFTGYMAFFKKPGGRGGKGKGNEAMNPESEQEYLARTPLPKPPQVFGIVEQRVGGSRMIVRCMDGKTRNCRIPGRLKKRL